MMSKQPPRAGARDWSSMSPYIDTGYKSTGLRGVSKNLQTIDPDLAALTGPAFGAEVLGEFDHDLTLNGRVNGEPIGERIIVTGRVLDETGEPIPNTLVEVWQCNATGRYVHRNDQHNAPLDPNFIGAGRCITDSNGRYRFISIKPAAYPWGNHTNAWRPAHIHFSLFGPTISTRLITQMYFPGDPLLEHDPIYQSVPAGARERMISQFSLDITQEAWALGYEFDIVLRDPMANPEA